MLYSKEEVCQGCKLSHWHYCEKCTDGAKFCHCEDKHESEINYTRGHCKYYEEK